MLKSLKNVMFATMILIVAFLFCGLTQNVFAETIIESKYFKYGDPTGDEIQFDGLSSPVSGKLIVPEYKEVIVNDETKRYYVTSIKNGTAGSLDNITSLDISNCSRLTSIFRGTFKTSTNLSGEIVFPASLTSLSSGNFESTKVTKMTFLGDLTDSITFKGNIPSTLEKLLITHTSYQSLTEGCSLLTYCDASLINYFGYVRVNGIETSVIKENGEYFTIKDFETLSKGIANFKGFTVEGNPTLYTIENITTLQYNNQNFIPQIEEEKAIYNVTYSSGTGYAFTGEKSVEEHENLSVEFKLNEFYNESLFTLSVKNNLLENVDFTTEKTENIYTITISDVTSDLNISVSGVTPNTYDIDILELNGLNLNNIKITDEIVLGYSIEGNINKSLISSSWICEDLDINSTQSTISLQSLTKGNYEVILTVTYEIDDIVITKTKTALLTVNDIIYNVTLPTNIQGYTINGNPTVKHGEDYVFNFELDKFYSDSDFVITILDKNNNTLATFNKHSQSCIIKNITGDIFISVSNVNLNELSVSLNASGESGQDISLLGDGANIVFKTVINGNLPSNSETYKYYLDGELLSNTSPEFTYENISFGNHSLTVIISIEEINKTYTSELTFNINKRIYDIKLNVSDFVYNNTVFNPSYTATAQNTCADYNFETRYLTLEGNTWKTTSEIKNVGTYKIEVYYDEEIVSLTQDSVTSCTFSILPKEVGVYYENKEYSFIFDNTRHFPQILFDADYSTWESLGLNLSEITEQLYILNSTQKVLVYDLPVNSSSEEYNKYSQYLVNAGNYNLELKCANKNFKLINSTSMLTSVNYTILPKRVEVSIQSGDVYGSTKSYPVKNYEIKLNEANEKVNLIVYFQRESGNNVGKYQITEIQTSSVETLGFNINNFEVVLSAKAENYYVISEKAVYVNWDDKTSFAFNGEYHAPECWVDDDFDGEIVLVVSGKQKLPCEKLQKYTATASCSSKNFKLINNTIEFVVLSTTLTSNGSVNCSIENTSGFQPDCSLILEQKTYSSSLLSSSKNSYFENYNISGGYSINVVNESGDDIQQGEKVNLNIEKPSYFRSGMKVLQVLSNGTLQEISYSTSGNYMVLKDVKLGSSFIFISPKSNFNIWTMLAIIFTGLTCIFGAWWIIKRVIKNKR